MSQTLLSKFPHLKKISLLHANLEVENSDITWSKQLSDLSIYNSSQAYIPPIIGSHVKKLTINWWPNLRNISAIKYFHNLEEFILNESNKLSYLPAKIFEKNGKLKTLKIYKNGHLTKLDSDTLFGLKNLTSVSLLGNPISSLPSDFFVNSPKLSHFSWEEDKCKEIQNRTFPKHMFKGLHHLKKFTYSQHHLKGYIR